MTPNLNEKNTRSTNNFFSYGHVYNLPKIVYNCRYSNLKTCRGFLSNIFSTYRRHKNNDNQLSWRVLHLLCSINYYRMNAFCIFYHMFTRKQKYDSREKQVCVKNKIKQLLYLQVICHFYYIYLPTYPVRTSVNYHISV